MSDRQTDQPKDQDLEKLLKGNPLLKSTAEAIARRHGLSLKEALEDLLEIW